MRLILDNEFTWDGVYNINDENGVAQYVIIAEIEERARTLRLFTKQAFDNAQSEADKKGLEEVNVLSVGNNPLDTRLMQDAANEYGVPSAELVQKAGLGKAKYTLSLRTRVIGSMLRQYNMSDDQYDTEILDWFVSGEVYNWEYIIVDKHGKIADSGVCGDKLALEYYKEEDKLKLALILMSLAALAHDMRESNVQAANGRTISQREPIRIPASLVGDADGSGLEEAIGMIRDGAEKISKFTGKFKKK